MGNNMKTQISVSTGLSEETIESIVSVAKENDIREIRLFGSRARGDYDEKSDIDLAVYGGMVEKFKLDIEEKVPTLLMFDVVDMEKSTSKSLKEIIDKEGIVIYAEI